VDALLTCVCRPASAGDSARAEAEATAGSQRADAIAAARFGVQAVVVELPRSAKVAPIRCVAADGSSPVGADWVPDDSRAERSAVPSTGAHYVPAVPTDDSCPDGCTQAAGYSAPVDLVAPTVVYRCAPAARTDDCRADYWERVGSAQAGLAGSDSADWPQADYLAAQQADDHSGPAVRMDGSFQAVDDSPADLAVGDCPVDSVPAGSDSADYPQADYLAAQKADDHSGLEVRRADSFQAADDSPADLAVGDCPVDSVPGDCWASAGYRVAGVPQVHSFQGDHSQPEDLLLENFQAVRSADLLDDFPPVAVAPV